MFIVIQMVNAVKARTFILESEPRGMSLNLRYDVNVWSQHSSKSLSNPGTPELSFQTEVARCPHMTRKLS